MVLRNAAVGRVPPNKKKGHSPFFFNVVKKRDYVFGVEPKSHEYRISVEHIFPFTEGRRQAFFSFLYYIYIVSHLDDVVNTFFKIFYFLFFWAANRR
jgi:hypothetical protein